VYISHFYRGGVVLFDAPLLATTPWKIDKMGEDEPARFFLSEIVVVS
jgi:hypothetical protein